MGVLIPGLPIILGWLLEERGWKEGGGGSGVFKKIYLYRNTTIF